MYERFAYVYDALMDLDYYDYWYDLIESYHPRGVIVDFGCGTGSMLLALNQKDRDLTGIDLSPTMIEVAKQKANQIEADVTFDVANMIHYKHHSPIDLALCLCDSINYLMSTSDLNDFISHVSSQVKQDGLFILDFHTTYKRDTLFADYHEQQDEVDYFLKWDVQKINDTVIEHHVVFKDYLDHFELDEVHQQMILDASYYIELLEKNGFIVVNHLLDFKPFTNQKKGERHIIVAQKKI